MKHMLSTIHQIAITVSEGDKALRFCQEVIGFPLHLRACEKFALLDADGFRLIC